MAEAQNLLKAQLAALAEEFAERLSRELPELAAQAQHLPLYAADQQCSALQVLAEQLHKLAGSCGTFGFQQLGEQARQLELQSNQWLQTRQITPAALDEFINAIEQLPALQQARHDSQEEQLHWQNRQQAYPLNQQIAVLDSQAQRAANILQTLHSFGYRATLHGNSANLLQHANSAVLLIEQRLLQEDPELAQWIEQQRRNGSSLLLISDDHSFAQQLAAVKAGAQGFIPSPVNMTALENTLERLFARQQNEPYRVLVIDDDQELAQRYALVLRQQNMLVDICQRPEQVLQHMQDFSPEVVLLDIGMPNCSGTELAQVLRFNDDWLRIPIIYLSAEVDQHRQLAALRQAGDDFINKPISDNTLLTRVFSRAQRARQLANALARDSLTGLLKHADIKEQLSQELLREQRRKPPTAVVMLDIDHFKRVNDQYGHPAGDGVIRALANLLRQRLRKADLIGRYGGEEFLAILPDCSAEQAEKVFNAIRENFAQLQFCAGEQAFTCTFSAGIAQSTLGCLADELISLADAALYQAKSAGRNCCIRADHPPSHPHGR